MCNSDLLLAIACSTYLQCTTMGPALTGLEEVTFLTNCSNGVGESGTPWSGQTVKWNCRTILSSWEPSFWREKVRTVYSARTSTSWMWTRIDPCTAFFSSGQYLWHFSWERKTTRILLSKFHQRLKNTGLIIQLTLPLSSRFVSMTMVADPCSHTRRQKSGIEAGTGPKGEPF